MQQWEKSAHVEFYTFDGMNGSNIMEANIDAIAIQHEAVPHWGQVHRDDLDLSAYYPALSEWQDAMDQIAIEGGDAANIFRHSFARNRNILHDLQV